MNPANLPDLPPLGPEGGLLRTIVWVALYVICIGGTVAYLIHKLPRKDEGPDGSGDEKKGPGPGGPGPDA